MDMKTLTPSPLWNYFHEITQIPRPSKKEERIIAYLKDFGERHQLVTTVDETGNVLICKPATAGYEKHKTIILQSHIDMVCEKNSDVIHNFDTDPIQTYIDGDWVKARGTTLGADNGIGISMMLAILASDELPHPALECLFTVDEETGLTGAFALKQNFLSGELLINLDSEDDGEIFVGCAGGIDTVAVITYKPEKTPENYFGFTASVKGLLGGHSGDDIDKGRGNANKILNRFLWSLNKKMNLRLHSFDGGNLRNAIPREATAVGCVPFSEKENIRVLFNLYVNDLEIEMGDVEPYMSLTLESEPLQGIVLDKKSSTTLLNALYACPHGVIGMSRDMPGMVETSTNLASVKTKANNTIEITTSQRSSVESSKHDIKQQVEAVFTLAGATVTQGDGYPGWKPNLKSEILKTATASYVKLYNDQPKVRAIHAGLECGLFLEKYPCLDMISIGPTMKGVHSPDERLSISSTQRCWEWLKAILAFQD
ncbi:MAG: aminoacyl-histidine dipeptidase [Bacteroidota bacterium]|nr:aminoacyl-histidine dipeptidase [Bacteroidota bacterium]